MCWNRVLYSSYIIYNNPYTIIISLEQMARFDAKKSVKINAQVFSRRNKKKEYNVLESR